MPDIFTLVQSLPRIPELRALAGCAARARLKFALRGGVLRNLYIRFHEWENREPSLFEFVDALSDIDLIVINEGDWAQLQRMLVASIPFAGFHRWEARTLSWVEGVQSDFEMVPVDRFVLWIDGTDGREGLLHWDAIGIDVREAMARYEQRRYPESLPTQWLLRDDRAQMLLAYLKLARYALQYDPGRAPVDRAWLMQHVERVANAWLARRRDGPAEATDPQFLHRVEMSVADILFNSLDWEEAIQLIRSMQPLLAHVSASSEFLTRALLAEDALSSPFVGVTYYRSTVGGDLQLRMTSSQQTDDAPEQGPGTIIPWTPMGVSGQSADHDCCRYVDFRYGPATILWRRVRPPDSFQDAADAGDYGAVARVNLATPYGHPDRIENDIFLPLPGILRTGAALSLRVDHGYIAARAPKNVTFDCGLTRMDWSAAEGSE